MRWLIWTVCLWATQQTASGYKRNALYGGPPRGPHIHVHHPYSKRHFNVNREHFRGPSTAPYPPKPHYSSATTNQGNLLPHLHSPAAAPQHLHSVGSYPHSGGHAFPVSHGVPFPQSHPAPVPYPNPNFIQQHNAYRAPEIQPVVAQPLPSSTSSPDYLPPPTPYIPPAATYLPAYLKDDDKGPIRTIPAPNLSPADKPAGFDEYLLKNSGIRAHSDLVSDYRKQLYHYQVQEDANQSKGTLFAPDPDPSVPTLKVPPTTDPHSIPSNGQVPLDLYLQDEAEKQQLLQEQALQQQVLQQHALHRQALQQQLLQSQQGDQEENALTAQDLFNLLNYQPDVIPESQLQQHVLQPNVQFYSNPLYLQHSQFMNPQYHNFNYDRRSQQSAYGSDSFPLQSLSSYFGDPEETADASNSVDTNEIGKKLDQRDTKKTIEKYRLEKSEKRPFTTLSSQQVADALASLSVGGALNNGDRQPDEDIGSDDRDEIMKQEENKAVALYESSFPSESETQARNVKADTDTGSNYNLVKSEKLSDFEVNLENHVQAGSRVRPKRY